MCARPSHLDLGRLKRLAGAVQGLTHGAPLAVTVLGHHHLQQQPGGLGLGRGARDVLGLSLAMNLSYPGLPDTRPAPSAAGMPVGLELLELGRELIALADELE